jgi:hypothetical protein
LGHPPEQRRQFFLPVTNHSSSSEAISVLSGDGIGYGPRGPYPKCLPKDAAKSQRSCANTESNAAVGASQSRERTWASARGAPSSRLMPESSHSMEIGPS